MLFRLFAHRRPKRVPRIGEILVGRGVLSRTQLESALVLQDRKERIGAALIRLGFITRPQLTAALAEQYRLLAAGAIGVAFLALEPASVMADRASTEMFVSAQVVNVTSVDAGPGADFAAAPFQRQPTIALSCTAGGMIRLGLARLANPSAFTGNAKANRIIDDASTTQWRLADCGTAGTLIPRLIVPAVIGSNARRGNGNAALDVLIEY